MKKLYSFTLFILLALASQSVHAQQPLPTIALEPATIEVPVGETVDIAVVVREAQELYGFDISLAFTPGAIEIVDSDAGTDGIQVGFGTFLESGFSLLNQVDNSAGTMRFAMTQVNPSPPKNGSGTLLVITVRGLQLGGSSQLTISNVELGQPRGIMLEATIEPNPASINIVEAVLIPPTAIPTQNTTAAEVAEILGTPVVPNNEQESSQDYPLMLIAIAAGGTIFLLFGIIILLLVQLRRKKEVS
jgi:hypothetical protein